MIPTQVLEQQQDSFHNQLELFLRSVTPSKGTVTRTLKKVQKFFESHKAELTQNLIDMNESLETIKNLQSVFKANCQETLKHLFELSPRYLKFLQFHYHSLKLDNPHEWIIPKNIREVLQACAEEGSVQRIFTTIENQSEMLSNVTNADIHVRAYLKQTLQNFSEDGLIPINVLIDIVDSQNPDGVMNILLLKVKKHILMTYTLVMANYDQNKPQKSILVRSLLSTMVAPDALLPVSLVLFPAIVTGGAIYSLFTRTNNIATLRGGSIQERENINEMMQDFSEELKCKDRLIITKNQAQEQWPKHVPDIKQKTLAGYMEKLLVT